MASTNLKPAYAFGSMVTHEGAPAPTISYEAQLRRSVMACMLWEQAFYEDGQSIAGRIVDLVGKVPAKTVGQIAVEARTKQHLRHVPLLLASAMSRTPNNGGATQDTITKIVQRPDELAELLAVHAKLNGVGPDKLKGKIPNAMKRGLAAAFTKFSAYSLGKYNRDNAIKLRDVMFLVCPKPKDAEQAETFAKLANQTLESPDTWEVELSSGKDKKETFTRLITENKLGYMALLRNLRGMLEAGVDEALLTSAIEARKGADRVLPFRYVAAARAAQQLEPSIDKALIKAIADLPVLAGKTVVLVDVSGSMDHRISAKSDLKRVDAAAALASMVNAESLRVFSFSTDVKEVPPRRGMAGVDAVINSQVHGATYLGAAVKMVNEHVECDRLIVLTDEQSADCVPQPKAKLAYMVNLAADKHGVGYKNGWKHIDGWSDNVLRYIAEVEKAV